jgi:hypothetical protein
MSQRTTFVLGVVLIAVLSVSIVAAIDLLGSAHSTSEFFVGVEFAYSNNVGDLKDLVDKVKNYTNLFVIGSVEMTFNRTALDESCDYIYDAGLYFIVLFTDTEMYRHRPDSTVYEALFWIYEARQNYGDKFLGVYRYDEPGGNQLDDGDSALLNKTDTAAYGTYTNASAHYVDYLNIIMKYYKYTSNEVFTADYGLYWFDYKAGYDTVFTEFGWNHSRQLHIALCRGAAKAFNRDWGAIVTWEYTDKPYIESEEELYEDMVLAYKTGAKYIVVFDYPKIEQYGILTDKHFKAIEDFWSYFNSNPQEHGVIQGETAYVLPADYGFGFRSPNDKIWGLWNAGDLSQKAWDDANKLLDQYDSRLDIVYNEPEIMDAVKSRYDRLILWNETVT